MRLSMADRPRPTRAAAHFTSLARFGVALALGATACIASADPMTFSFEGSLAQDPFGLSQVGAPVSGRYTFDPAAVDGIAQAGSGSYTSTGAAFGFGAVVDGMAWAVAGSVNIGLQVGQPGWYLVTAQAGSLTLELVLQDLTGAAITSDALLLAPPALSAFALREFRLFDANAEFSATLDSLQAVTPGVPEPGVAGLLLAGLAVVGLSTARRRRRLSRSNP